MPLLPIMVSRNEMSSQIKQGVDGRMGIEKSLRLHLRFETAYFALCQQIFNIPMTEIEPEIGPHRISG